MNRPPCMPKCDRSSLTERYTGGQLLTASTLAAHADASAASAAGAAGADEAIAATVGGREEKGEQNLSQLVRRG